MRQILFIVLISLLALSACKKNSDISGLNGSWRLIAVYDKKSATVNLHPPASNMDIVITFLGGNKFAGHTLRNTLTDGTYKQNGNEMVFGSFSMTKIAEDEWGGSFLTVLNACSLQSAVPCAPSEITMQGNMMKIVTSLRYDVTLARL